MTEELEKKIAKLKKGDKKAFDYVYEKTNRAPRTFYRTLTSGLYRASNSMRRALIL